MVKQKKNKRVKKQRLDKIFVGMITRLPKYVLVLGFVGVILVSYFGYVQTRNYLEKRDLEHKFQHIELLSEKIESTGVVEEISFQKDCGYSSQKFVKGDLSCIVGASLNLTNSKPVTYNGIIDGYFRSNDFILENKTIEEEKSVFELNGGTMDGCILSLVGTDGLVQKLSIVCVKETNSQYFHQKS